MLTYSRPTSGSTQSSSLEEDRRPYTLSDCLAISAVAGWYRVTICTKDNDHAGMRSFAVAGPVIWNSLPAALRTATRSPLTFARHLKAYLFGLLAARLRTIYDALYKSTHHHHHHHHHHLATCH